MSLEDYTVENPTLITSPRSKLAMQRLGILQSELLLPKVADFMQDFPEPELQEKCVDHYRALIPQLLEQLRAERDKIVKEEGKDGRSLSHQTIEQLENATLEMIQNEKRAIEKLKVRQISEVKKLIESEVKAAELRDAAEELARKREQEEVKARRQVEEQRVAQEKARQAAEDERKQKAEEYEHQLRRKMQEDQAKLEERARLEKEAQAQKKLDAERRAKEDEAKRKQFQERMEATAKAEEEKAKEKRLVLEEKEKKRKQANEEKQMQMKREAEEAFLEQAKRFAAVAKRNEEILQEKREKFEERQAHTLEKKQAFEETQRALAQKKKVDAEKKIREIAQVLQKNEEVQRKKLEDYAAKQEQLTIRQEELRQLKETETISRKQKNERFVEHLSSVIEKNILQMQKNCETLKEKERVKIDKVNEHKKAFDHEVRMKCLQTYLRRREKQEIIQRAARANEFLRTQKDAELKTEQDRLAMAVKKKDELMETRFKLKRDLQMEKERVNNDFQKVQAGKLDINEIAKRYNIDVNSKGAEGGEEPAHSKSRSPPIKKLASQSKVTVSQSKNPSTLPKIYQSAASIHPEGKQPAARDESAHSKTLADAGNQQKVGKSSNTNEMKLKFNEQLIMMIVNEREKEKQRTQLLDEAAETNRNKLEEQFVKERALALRKIQQKLRSEKIGDELLKVFV